MGWIAGLGMSWTGEVHLLFSPASKFVITKSFLCSAFADVQNPESFKFAFLYKQRPGVAKGWTYREWPPKAGHEAGMVSAFRYPFG